jgi:hypothetical protein
VKSRRWRDGEAKWDESLLYRDTSEKFHVNAGDYSFCRGYTEKPILKTGLEVRIPSGCVPP